MKIEITERKTARLIEIAELVQETLGSDIANLIKECLVNKEFITRKEIESFNERFILLNENNVKVLRQVLEIVFE